MKDHGDIHSRATPRFIYISSHYEDRYSRSFFDRTLQRKKKFSRCRIEQDRLLFFPHIFVRMHCRNVFIIVRVHCIVVRVVFCRTCLIAQIQQDDVLLPSGVGNLLSYTWCKAESYRRGPHSPLLGALGHASWWFLQGSDHRDIVSYPLLRL